MKQKSSPFFQLGWHDKHEIALCPPPINMNDFYSDFLSKVIGKKSEPLILTESPFTVFQNFFCRSLITKVAWKSFSGRKVSFSATGIEVITIIDVLGMTSASNKSFSSTTNIIIEPVVSDSMNIAYRQWFQDFLTVRKIDFSVFAIATTDSLRTFANGPEMRDYMSNTGVSRYYKDYRGVCIPIEDRETEKIITKVCESCKGTKEIQLITSIVPCLDC